MKTIHFIILAILNFSATFGQTEKLFIIKEVFVYKNFEKKNKSHFQKQNTIFFEDETYIVSKTCHGEFGGHIIFKNKNTEIEYTFNATCPIMVNKIDGKYLITNTLSHLHGISEVLELDSGLSMKQLVDSVGVLALTSFPYKGQLYHIITDYKKTYIAKIENKKFITVDLVSNKNIWTYDPEVITTVDNHVVVFFKNENAKGYMDIFEDKINVIQYK